MMQILNDIWRFLTLWGMPVPKTGKFTRKQKDILRTILSGCLRFFSHFNNAEKKSK